MAQLLFPLSNAQHLLVDARKLTGIEQHACIPTVLDVHLLTTLSSAHLWKILPLVSHYGMTFKL